MPIFMNLLSKLTYVLKLERVKHISIVQTAIESCTHDFIKTNRLMSMRIVKFTIMFKTTKSGFILFKTLRNETLTMNE